MFGMIVLVVDVGGLLWKRRELVNASDAAALSAAQTVRLKLAIDAENAQTGSRCSGRDRTFPGTGLTGIVQDSGNLPHGLGPAG